MLSRRDVLTCATLVALVTVVVARAGTQVFDFFDMSVLMDAGYRVTWGQRPYVDFYFNSGPVHPYLHALFFRLFGFGTHALLAHVAVLNGLAMVATFVVARRHLPLDLTSLLTLASGLCFYGIVAHPWYNQSACFFVIAGALAIVRLQPLETPGRAALAGFLAGLGGAAGLMARVDFGAGGLAAFGAALACTGDARRAGAGLAGLALGAALGLAGLLATVPAREFLFQMSEYVPRARLFVYARLVELAGRTPTLLVVAAAIRLARRDPVSRARFRLLLGLCGTSFLTGYTSYMRLSANVPLLGLELLLLALLAGDRARGVLLVAVGATVAWGAYLLHTHDAWAWRASNLTADYPLKSAPMAGWLVERRQGEAVDACVAYLRERVPPTDSVFVFPDTTVIYALAGREPYRGAPAIFLLGAHESSPPPGALTERFRDHFLNHPPRWIVLHHERESPITHTANLLALLRLDNFLRDRYRPVTDWNDLELLELKP